MDQEEPAFEISLLIDSFVRMTMAFSQLRSGASEAFAQQVPIRGNIVEGDFLS